MKIFFRVVIALVLLVLLALGAALLFIDPLVKGGIEKGATYAAGTDTKVGSVDASVFAGHFGLKDLAIANPTGFRAEPFLHLGSASAGWDNGTIFSDDIAMKTLTLDGVELNLESAGGKTNYGAILDNLQKLGGGAKPAEPSSKPAKKLSIQRIEIKNVRASLHVSGIPLVKTNGDLEVNVPLVAIDDFHTDGTTSEIVGKLTRALVQAVLQGSLDAGKGTFPADVVKDLSGNLQKISGDLKTEAKEVMKGLDSNLKGAQETLKSAGDLFKGKKK
jgi:hypothetical protein